MSGFQLFGAITVFGTIAVVLVCFVLYARIISKRHFKCPYCSERFKSSAMRAFFSAHQGANRLMMCPNCGKSGYMELLHDKDHTGEQSHPQPDFGERTEYQTRLLQENDFIHLGNGLQAVSQAAPEKTELYAKCTSCGYFMRLSLSENDICFCGRLSKDIQTETIASDLSDDAIEIYKCVPVSQTKKTKENLSE
jgi:DNA-directed RNA polymerase subunit RPC12/RpoP